VKLDDDLIAQMQGELPELPQAKQARYESAWSLSTYDAATLTASRATAEYYETVVAKMPKQDAKLAANWVMGELSGTLNKEGLDIGASKIDAASLAALLGRIQDGTLSGKLAKQVFDLMWTEGGEPDAIIEARGLKQMSDSGEIEKIIDEVLAANQKSVEEFRAGKDKAFNALVGQVMKASRGKANPAQVNELLKKKLAG
jgi:aspartyl-tRNA(Asn)/glutamyl-tRNA(Gln) amidotransferase subunit B